MSNFLQPRMFYPNRTRFPADQNKVSSTLPTIYNYSENPSKSIVSIEVPSISQIQQQQQQQQQLLLQNQPPSRSSGTRQAFRKCHNNNLSLNSKLKKIVFNQNLSNLTSKNNANNSNNTKTKSARRIVPPNSNTQKISNMSLIHKQEEEKENQLPNQLPRFVSDVLIAANNAHNLNKRRTSSRQGLTMLIVEDQINKSSPLNNSISINSSFKVKQMLRPHRINSNVSIPNRGYEHIRHGSNNTHNIINISNNRLSQDEALFDIQQQFSKESRRSTHNLGNPSVEFSLLKCSQFLGTVSLKTTVCFRNSKHSLKKCMMVVNAEVFLAEPNFWNRPASRIKAETRKMLAYYSRQASIVLIHENPSILEQLYTKAVDQWALDLFGGAILQESRKKPGFKLYDLSELLQQAMLAAQHNFPVSSPVSSLTILQMVTEECTVSQPQRVYQQLRFPYFDPVLYPIPVSLILCRQPSPSTSFKRPPIPNVNLLTQLPTVLSFPERFASECLSFQNSECAFKLDAGKVVDVQDLLKVYNRVSVIKQAAKIKKQCSSTQNLYIDSSINLEDFRDRAIRYFRIVRSQSSRTNPSSHKRRSLPSSNSNLAACYTGYHNPYLPNQNNSSVNSSSSCLDTCQYPSASLASPNFVIGDLIKKNGLIQNDIQKNPHFKDSRHQKVVEQLNNLATRAQTNPSAPEVEYQLPIYLIIF